jgi:ribonuclease I
VTETNQTNSGVLDNVLGWLHRGYPEGVPQKDYFALLALLKRSLSEEEVVKAAQAVLRGSDSDTVSEDEIRAAVHNVIEKEPNPEEIHQVAARLASVGWPLQDCTH